jgi:hypothetical protein
MSAEAKEFVHYAHSSAQENAYQELLNMTSYFLPDMNAASTALPNKTF